jgi:putative heme-binding domain-containing protein
LSASDRSALEKQLARFARTASTQDLLARQLRDRSSPAAVRLSVLSAMAQSGLREAPKAWLDGLAELLMGDDKELTPLAVATTRALGMPKTQTEGIAAALLAVARNADAPAAVRLDALAAVPGGLADVTPALFTFLRAQLDPEGPVASRTTSADVLSKAKLTAQQLDSLTDALRTAGPLEAGRLLGAYAQSNDDALGLKLLSVLQQSPCFTSLRAETIKPNLVKFGPGVQQKAEELYSTLNADAAKQKARLEEMLSLVSAGDVRRGQAVFNSPKAACASCHAIGYLGGNLGPDLTRIGQTRTERDLLEAVVFPSASFVRSYEPVTVATKDGKVLNGLVRRDAADEVVLATGANEEARIARGDIDEMRPGTVSVMPAGLDQQLTTQDIADLLAFLKACK